MLPWVSPLIVARRAEAAPINTKHLVFNGTNEYLVSASGDVGVANAWTILFQAMPSAIPTGLSTVWVGLGLQSASLPNRVYLNCGIASSNAQHTVVLYPSGGGSPMKSLGFGPTYVVNVGCHSITTYDGALAGDPVLHYKNGVSQSKTGTDNAGTQTGSNRCVFVGAFYVNSLGQYITGKISEVAIWNIALGAAEVAYLYANRNFVNLKSNAGDYVSSANLKHWYLLGLDPSNIGKDYVDTAPLHLTPVNMDATNIGTGLLVP